MEYNESGILRSLMRNMFCVTTVRFTGLENVSAIFVVISILEDASDGRMVNCGVGVASDVIGEDLLQPTIITVAMTAMKMNEM
jgi:hypothetical protein